MKINIKLNKTGYVKIEDFCLNATSLGCILTNSKAGIAQLVERNLAKVEVAGSSPVSRSTFLVIFLQEYYDNF